MCRIYKLFIFLKSVLNYCFELTITPQKGKLKLSQFKISSPFLQSWGSILKNLTLSQTWGCRKTSFVPTVFYWDSIVHPGPQLLSIQGGCRTATPSRARTGDAPHRSRSHYELWGPLFCGQIFWDMVILLVVGSNCLVLIHSSFLALLFLLPGVDLSTLWNPQGSCHLSDTLPRKQGVRALSVSEVHLLSSYLLFLSLHLSNLEKLF